jgi:hypothetical protein
MGLFNKEENWWLRLSLVLFVLIALGSASVMNRSVATDRQILMDSVSYLKLQNDSLTDENFNLNVELGRHELTRDEIFRRHKGLENEYNQYLEHETE